MAWTVPMTWVAGNALTAAQLNVHLRDNLLETAPAKASASSQIFVAQSRYRLQARTPTAASVSTSETTVSGEWTDLATPGPSVTVRTGERAIILWSVRTSNTSAAGGNNVTYQLTGATERDPLFSTCLRFDGITAANEMSYSQFDMVTTLTPGLNTFTLKYRRGSGTATFQQRQIAVWPL